MGNDRGRRRDQECRSEAGYRDGDPVDEEIEECSGPGWFESLAGADGCPGPDKPERQPGVEPRYLDIPVAQRGKTHVRQRLDDTGVDDAVPTGGRPMCDHAEVVQLTCQHVRDQRLCAGERGEQVDQGDAALAHGGSEASSA